MISQNTFFLWAFPIGFILTAILTFLFRKVAIHNRVLDVPNERSSHSSSIPRGGGLAVIVTFFVFLLVYRRVLDGLIDVGSLRSLLFGGVIVAAVGFFDDLKSIPASWRFLSHLSAAFLALSLLPSLPYLTVFGINFDLGTFGYIFYAVSLVWFVNLFNFMDGIDGIGGIEAITVLASGGLILFAQGQAVWLPIFTYLAVCIGGFLVWNWPPAKVFMGDACSGFLGFTLGLFAIITSLEGAINLWAWLILFGVFVVDATTTLIRRVVRGEKWYEAHRSHAYQILSRRFGSHQKVSVGVMIINLLWLCPLAFLAAIFPFWGLLICCIALLPLLVLAIQVGAGVGEAQEPVHD